MKRFGAGFEATLWRSPEAQRLRFDVLIDMIGPDIIAGSTLLDVGCGIGDLARHLVDRKIDVGRFIGIDAMPGMIESARQSAPPGAEFLEGDFIADPGIIAAQAPDVILVSGSFNTLEEDVVDRVLDGFFQAATTAVAYNFLGNRPGSRWKDVDLAPARRFDLVRRMDHALELTPRVSMRQEYLDGHDVSIAMFREDA